MHVVKTAAEIVVVALIKIMRFARQGLIWKHAPDFCFKATQLIL